MRRLRPASSGRPITRWSTLVSTWNSTNECELELECTVLEVSSNESIDGLGDGSTSPDWMIDGEGNLKLRAERSGTGSDRVYTIRVRCEHPDSGIGDETTVEVVVPHDRGGRIGATDARSELIRSEGSCAVLQGPSI